MFYTHRQVAAIVCGLQSPTRSSQFVPSAEYQLELIHDNISRLKDLQQMVWDDFCNEPSIKGIYKEILCEIQELELTLKSDQQRLVSFLTITTVFVFKSFLP